MVLGGCGMPGGCCRLPGKACTGMHILEKPCQGSETGVHVPQCKTARLSLGGLLVVITSHKTDLADTGIYRVYLSPWQLCYALSLAQLRSLEQAQSELVRGALQEQALCAE